jgi:hypothetical protein
LLDSSFVQVPPAIDGVSSLSSFHPIYPIAMNVVNIWIYTNSW